MVTAAPSPALHGREPSPRRPLRVFRASVGVGMNSGASKPMTRGPGRPQRGHRVNEGVEVLAELGVLRREVGPAQLAALGGADVDDANGDIGAAVAQAAALRRPRLAFGVTTRRRVRRGSGPVACRRARRPGPAARARPEKRGSLGPAGRAAGRRLRPRRRSKRTRIEPFAGRCARPGTIPPLPGDLERTSLGRR